MSPLPDLVTLVPESTCWGPAWRQGLLPAGLLGSSLGGGAESCCSSLLTLCVAPTQILVHIGFLTEESGDVFSPRVLKGGPLGEMVQWADILAALYVLGHGLRVTVSLKELQR